MILAAGAGTRLFPLTLNLPKPMAPIANQPLMDRIVKLLHAQGFDSLIANLHSQPHVIIDYFQDNCPSGVSIEFRCEKELLGTAGGVRNCKDFFDDTFAVISGDALTDVDLTFLLNEHKKNGALCTLALKTLENCEKYGVAVTDERGRITAFQEKPEKSEAVSNRVNTGIYIFEPEIFTCIPVGYFDFGSQLFPELVRGGAPIYAVEIADYWCDVGDKAVYMQAHQDLAYGRIALDDNFGVLESYENGGRAILGKNIAVADNVQWHGFASVGANSRLGPGATIKNTIIWDNCIIGKGVSISNAIITSGCRIEAYSRVTGTVYTGVGAVQFCP